MATRKALNSRKTEKLMQGIMLMCSLISVVTTVGIILVLLVDSWKFFGEVSIVEFVTGTVWTPLFENKQFGILPLLSGTLLTTTIACVLAVPVGITIAVYLNEYASPKFTAVVKPILEVLAAVPTVVYGFFALQFVTPLLQQFIPGLAGFNALSPGLVMGLMIIPYITSLSEDALRAVPNPFVRPHTAWGPTVFRLLLKSLFRQRAQALLYRSS
jgi:phosphate transport system permease protein